MINIGEYEKLSVKMTHAYMNHNLEQLDELMHEKMGNDCDVLPEEEDRLIYDRNNNWIKQMPSIMKEYSTLFAVGAGHLTGERGLLNLLRKQGYTLEPIK